MQLVTEFRVPPMLREDALRRHPQMIEEEARKTLQGDVLLLEGAISERAPVDRGTMRGATASEVRGTGVNLTGRVWNPTLYAPAIESGGRAHQAPLANILAWARRVIGGPNANRIGRAVWVAIRQTGTKARPFWAPAWKATLPQLERRHEAMLQRIVRRLTGER